MKSYLAKLLHQLKSNLPLLVIISIALIIAFQNIEPNTYYSGWDNTHAEFDLGRYAKQVFFGSWLEHQGLGAPAALAHLSEISRLPIIWLFKTLLPDNLVRYTYIFSTYLIGGIGVYLYLSKHWLQNKSISLKKWLASLGGVLYLLHVVTLQQFYISFEVFMAQFAFFPFLLLIIQRLHKQFNIKNILIFILVQLLIAPSGHTSAIFYLGVLFSLLYSFFLKLDKAQVWAAFRFSFLIGLITLLVNFYWILPNLYYGLHNSSYVQESHENQVFGPESLWSIKEAGNISNFLRGTHYLFTWKDYSFTDSQHELIFNEWLPHLQQPLTLSIMYALGTITILGLLLTIIDRKQGLKRWGVIIFYLFSIAFVWIELLPTEVLINKLFQSESFLEVFRNPFTKFSILYSFVSVLLFVKTIEVTVGLIKNKFLIISFLTILNLSIAYQAWPSFQGHFISEKLRIEYPTQYWDMFEYLQAKDEDLRILQLPQRSHAGWEYYDWSFLKPGNGYQGMGFYFFGFPQPFLNRDSDRWVETSDFFYHELKYALDTKNSDQFIKILDKYEVDLLIIDETKIEPGLNHNYNLDHQLAIAAGLEKIWEQDFITIYQKQTSNQDSQLLIPTQITPLSADTDRIRKDYVYSQHDDYLLTDGDEASLIYPFANLMSKEASNVSIGDNQTQISTNVQKQDYHLKLPGLKDEHYFTPINISYKDQKVKVEFPTNKIDLSDKTIILPKLNDFEFKVSEDYSTIIVFFNKMGIIIDQGKTATPVISLEKNQPISVSYTEKSDDMVFSHKDELTNPNLEITPKLDLDLNWQQLQAGIDLQVKNLDQINLISEFPHIPLDLSQNPSVNCSADESGQIVTKYDNGKITYQADAYAVSCNSYSFNYMSPAYSYLMNISGHNYQGRSTKFFINYSVSGVSPEAYLMPNGSFDIFLTLHQVSEDPNSRHYLNWETRSFGKLNIDEINGIKIAPFPLEQMSKLSIFKDKLTPLNNDQLEIRSDIILFDSTHLINFRCKQEKCYLGIDQSYDDLWIGLEVDELKLLSHHRLNNWANLWEINKGEGRIIIFYLPEVISLFSLILLGTTITFLIIKLKKTTNVKKYPKIKHKTKRHLRGK